MPKTWGRIMTPVMELNTLQATCRGISGMAHRYWIHRTTRNRVKLTYSNPDEWASDHPISCYLPCYEQDGICWVVLTPTCYRNVGEDWEYDPHQAFTAILDIDQEYIQDPNTYLAENEYEDGRYRK